MAVTTTESNVILEGLEQIFNKPAKLDGEYVGGAASVTLTLPTPLDRDQIKSLATLLDKLPVHLDVELKRSGAGQSICFQ